MARKNTLLHKVAAAQSLATAFHTNPTLIRYLDNCSYQINITTSDSTGTFAVEASNDYYVNEGNDALVTNPGTWVALPLGGGTPFSGGANDSILIDLNQLPFNAIRISYTPIVAGTGVADIYVVDKSIGA